MSAVAALSPFAMANPAISMRFSARRSLCQRGAGRTKFYPAGEDMTTS